MYLNFKSKTNNNALEFHILQGGCVKESFNMHVKSVTTPDYCFGNVFQGFRYLSPIDFDDTDSIFIVATYGDCVIGVLKIKRYAVHNHRFVKEDESIRNYVAIRYIDVHESYKGKGVGTELLHHMSCYLKKTNKTNIVKLSPMTEEGAKFNVLGRMKQMLPDYKVSVVKR